MSSAKWCSCDFCCQVKNYKISKSEALLENRKLRISLDNISFSFVHNTTNLECEAKKNSNIIFNGAFKCGAKLNSSFCDDFKPSEGEETYIVSKMRNYSNSKMIRRRRDLCDKVTTKNGQPNCHKHSIHSRAPYDCNLRDKVFKRNNKLKLRKDLIYSKRNLNTLEDPAHSKVKFECDFCAKVFTRRVNLNHHKNSAHLGRPRKCDLCDAVFTRRDKLKLHKESLHLRLRYYCYLCGEVFSRKDSLKLHVDSIHLEARYECDLCDKVFKRMDKLKYHKDLTHLRNQRGNSKVHLQSESHKWCCCDFCCQIQDRKISKSKELLENRKLRISLDNVSFSFFNNTTNSECGDRKIYLKNSNILNGASKSSVQSNSSFLIDHDDPESSALSGKSNSTRNNISNSSLIEADFNKTNHYGDTPNENLNASSTSNIINPSSSILDANPNHIVEATQDVENSINIHISPKSSQTNVSNNGENQHYQYLKCRECAQVFYLEDDLSKHMEIHNFVPKELLCLFCGEIFSEIVSYQNHLHSHFQ